MTARFIQLHYLTTYAANNLNRDDLGRPKSLDFGNTMRLRISSQCIKRAWRTSDDVAAVLAQIGEGVRSREQWLKLGEEFVARGYPEATVVQHVSALRTIFVGSAAGEEAAEEVVTAQPEEVAAAPEPGAKKAGKAKKGKAGASGLDTLRSDLFYFSASEIDLARALLSESLNPDGPTKGEPHPAKEVLARLDNLPMSGDVAMFGRMVAANKALSVEGAIQVAHPFTVIKSVVDDDYFVAVDDLSDNGGAHVGSNGFGSGLYYGYLLVDVELLLRNLGNDSQKARALLTALLYAVATVSPGGKQNTFSARSYATFMMAETGSAQPRSFADAYLTPIKGDGLAERAIEQLSKARNSLVKVFPSQRTEAVAFDRTKEDTLSIDDLVEHVCRVLPA